MRLLGSRISSDRFGSPVHLAGRFFTSLRSTPPPAADDAWAIGYLLAGESVLWRRMSGADRRHAVGVGRATVSLLSLAESGTDGSVPAGVAVVAPPEAAGDRAVVAPAEPGVVPTGPAEAGVVAATDRVVVAAALLHDVGKIEAGLGTVGRAAVTAAAMAVGPQRLSRAVGGRAARYLDHSAIGAAMLAGAGSDPVTIAWTLEHHLPPEAWTVPPAVGAALKEADDD